MGRDILPEVVWDAAEMSRLVEGLVQVTPPEPWQQFLGLDVIL
jgi:hypothetical protein